MRIDEIDAFYLSMPEVEDVGDGSQDMLLVRVRAGAHTGWGEAEASPLTTIAGLVTPMSHSACHGVAEVVRGQDVAGPVDIARIAETVRLRCMDLLQADHVWSGIEIALWDLLGRALDRPVHELLGQAHPLPKVAYASQLFGDTPQATLDQARATAGKGYAAAKFGWGPYGLGDPGPDADHVMAAREGLGPDRVLLVDAGTVFGEDVDAAAARIPALREAGVVWLEEPFESGALSAYAALAGRAGGVRLAAGEGAHTRHQARHLIDYGAIGYVQVDTGRIGGIGPSADVARYAAARGVRFVNHTFTSHLALSASLQPYAASADDVLCEYPVQQRPLARDLTRTRIEVDGDGRVRVPEGPGLGLDLDLEAVRPYLRDVRVVVDGEELYRTPELTA